ncbi:MAG: Rne/Rng family ribonuclease [Alphaproteobacteria bacterium]|nr:Rne/Rng family ribonuclease [Alphaproteobacteria bacterium]
MAKRMLIDSTHPEETRVVVLDGNRLEEFDFETASKKQLKGNIYLARVTRVEPSLQAAFVEFGGNRHGFLAFNEIHPDYYRIPVADRHALMVDDDEDDHVVRSERPRREAEGDAHPAPEAPAADPVATIPLDTAHDAGPVDIVPPPPAVAVEAAPAAAEPAPAAESAPLEAAAGEMPVAVTGEVLPPDGMPSETAPAEAAPAEEGGEQPRQHHVESLGGDTVEDAHETRRRARPQRHYKIQEVLKRRQVLLVQVVKEERGNKGAALTTYLSLAGRYCVLMPNTDRGGGISRRITSQQDRKRLKNLIEELEVPDGMAVILRTAGMERDTTDIRRDYEYLMRLWEEIRDLTLRSTAPSLIYEEGSLIKRAIRDMYSADIDDILVEGETGFEAARHFMGMLMPSDITRIRRYDDAQVPLFQRFQVESELDEMHLPTVRLKSGGYIVINSTEALVAIDVNSGRSTRERNIDETAYKTNLEAADEVARQLRLRDLAGLIVIDFIDMDDHRHQSNVERRLKEAMKSDRARIQIGRISAFGLLELSRQRLRPSISEISFEVCPHCNGTGRLRSTESAALHVLRGIEEEAGKMRAAEVSVYVATSVALYLFNNKRAALAGIESRFGMRVSFHSDDTLIPPAFRIERARAKAQEAQGAAPIRHVEDFTPSLGTTTDPSEARARDEGHEDEVHEGERTRAPREGSERNEEGGRGRRRRRRGRGRDREDRGEDQPNAPQQAADSPEGAPQGEDDHDDAASGGEAPREGAAGDQGGDDASRRRRRRGRRGGRRRGRRGEEGSENFAAGDAPQAENSPAPAPTGAEPSYTAPAYAVDPQLGRVQGPGDDRFPLPERVAGPGDSHDWPWNKPNAASAAPVAHAPAASEPIRVTEPPPAAPAPQAAPVADVPPPEDDPNRPKKRGWWNRLTG